MKTKITGGIAHHPIGPAKPPKPEVARHTTGEAGTKIVWSTPTASLHRFVSSHPFKHLPRAVTYSIHFNGDGIIMYFGHDFSGALKVFEAIIGCTHPPIVYSRATEAA